MNFLHRHSFVPYKLMYPVAYWSSVYFSRYKGTAIFSKCECGAKQRETRAGKYRIVDGFVIEEY